MDRMTELIKILNEASKAYYSQDKELMSNLEYDKLYDELTALEQETGIVFANSPTVRVGYEVVSELKKAPHEQKMLSLDKTKEISKLKAFLNDGKGVLSWKLDGLTIALKYENGSLVQALTRGNGEIGEDITSNAKAFVNLPLKIKFKGELIIRGEAIISYSDFEKINEGLGAEEKYKNPRNLCAGTVRQLNSEIVAKRNVTLIAFSLVKIESTEKEEAEFNNSKYNQLKWLEAQGFKIVEHSLVSADTIEGDVQRFKERVGENDFASDGLVLTYDSISYSESLGATSKFPKDTIAFKWADEVGETVLTEVIWNTSRTGLINPVACFAPVELEGTTVSRASLHNLSILESLRLGLGDRITVYKANMIIPQVAENLTQSNNIEIPKLCPECGYPSEIEALNDVKMLFCKNPNCKAQLVRGLSHFVSRDAMNIEGLSQQTIEKFVEHRFIENYVDIFYLGNHREAIVELEGFGEKSFNNLIKAVEKAKNVALPNFIYALGISNVGLSNAKLLCQRFSYSIEEIRAATKEELVGISGFGEIISGEIIKYFSQKENNQLLDKALKLLEFKEAVVVKEDKLKDLTFVITGDLKSFANRKELKEKIESLGGRTTEQVTAKTSYLINNDIGSGSSKNKKAASLNIPIISEEQFIEQFL